jgi:hypothetical protein
MLFSAAWLFSPLNRANDISASARSLGASGKAFDIEAFGDAQAPCVGKDRRRNAAISGKNLRIYFPYVQCSWEFAS